MTNKNTKTTTNFQSFTFDEHIQELRIRVIKVVVTLICTTSLAFFFSWDFLFLLSEPLKISSDNKSLNFIYTKLTEAFFVEFKIALYLGIFCTIPVFFYQLYKFIAPGLYKDEKKITIYCFIFPVILFILAATFVYFIIMPIMWKFFLGFQIDNHNNISISFLPKISDYIDLIIELLMGFGIAFQTPVFLVLLVNFNIISLAKLIEFRRYAIVIIFIVAAILTPPDIISQIALAIPMIILYEASILVCKNIIKNNA